MWFLVTIIYLLRTGYTIFWILDVCNMPFMEIFDTIYPLNEEFYILMFIFVSGFIIQINQKR